MSGITRWTKALGGTVATAALLSGCLDTSPTLEGRTTPAARPSAATAAPSAAATFRADPDGVLDTAMDVLARLPVKGRAAMTGYDRSRFGQAWLDADRNGCDTRNDVLGGHLTNIAHRPGTRDCVVESGDLADPYTGRQVHFVRGDGFLVDIDHVVALANVWVTGGSGWDIKKRAAIANDPMNLEPVDASTNRQKGAGDAATWLPPNKGYRCAYVARQIAVKDKYALWVTPPEQAALARILMTCPDQPVPENSGAPTEVTLNIHDPYDEASHDGDPGQADGSVYYPNCDAARAAGAAPIRRGDPGYASHLDREGDGSACE